MNLERQIDSFGHGSCSTKGISRVSQSPKNFRSYLPQSPRSSQVKHPNFFDSSVAATLLPFGEPATTFSRPVQDQRCDEELKTLATVSELRSSYSRDREYPELNSQSSIGPGHGRSTVMPLKERAGLPQEPLGDRFSPQASDCICRQSAHSVDTVYTSVSQRKARRKQLREHEQRIREAEPFAALLLEDAIQDSEKMRRLLHKRADGQLRATDPGLEAELIHLHYVYNLGGWDRAVREARWFVLRRVDKRQEEIREEARRQASKARVSDWLCKCMEI